MDDHAKSVLILWGPLQLTSNALTEYVEQDYIRKDTIEKRSYQTNLAQHAMSKNCLVVLPTGLGKTAIALQVIAKYLSDGTGSILFLAPTRVLVNQHL